MKAKQNALGEPSEREKVDAYMQGLKHPLADVIQALRRIILSKDREIGEEEQSPLKPKPGLNGPSVPGINESPSRLLQGVSAVLRSLDLRRMQY